MVTKTHVSGKEYPTSPIGLRNLQLCHTPVSLDNQGFGTCHPPPQHRHHKPGLSPKRWGSSTGQFTRQGWEPTREMETGLTVQTPWRPGRLARHSLVCASWCNGATRTGGFDNRHWFPPSLRAGSPRPRCRQSWFLLRPCSLDCRSLPFPCVLTGSSLVFVS